MLRRILGPALFLCALVPAACDDTVVDPGERGTYLEPTSPENLIANLMESYDRKEIEEYAKLLAPEFIFKFQPADLDLIEDEFWTRGQDSTGTAGLFGSPVVGDIRINLVHGPAEATDELSFDPGVMLVRINPTQLEVDQIGGSKKGITYQVDGDIQDMFFRQGKAELGENPAHWFLVEWRDIPNPAGAAGTRIGAGVRPASVESSTWGQLKAYFKVP